MRLTKTKKRFFFYTSTILLTNVLLLTGCAVGPDYKKPDQWTPSKWEKPAAGKDSQSVVSETNLRKPSPEWWDCFNDPMLSNLEKQVSNSNLDVLLSTQRLLESRAQMQISGADRFPALNASGGYSRTQYSNKSISRAVHRAINSRNGSSLGPMINSSDIDVPTLNEWMDNIDTSWEVDLWGRVRRQYESAHANWQASEEERRGVLITQQAEVAHDYIALRGFQAQLAIVKENQKIAQESLLLAKQRFTGGLVTELDIQTAEAQLDQTVADIPQLEQQIAEQTNALALLLGKPPRALSEEFATVKPIPPVPPQIPVGLPSELARRRPDIRQAESQLHAATAEVGVAVANFYPKVTINAQFGFQSLSFRDLGFWSSRAWNVGPTISLPIFQGGRLKGQLALKKAQQKEAAIFYQKTVLQAWHEVDNALTAYRAEQLRKENIEKTVKANQRAVYLAQEQYRQGLQNFINVLDAERRLLTSQKDLVQSTTQISTNLVQLYKALGGGWETTFPINPPNKS